MNGDPHLKRLFLIQNRSQKYSLGRYHWHQCKLVIRKKCNKPKRCYQSTWADEVTSTVTAKSTNSSFQSSKCNSWHKVHLPHCQVFSFSILIEISILRYSVAAVLPVHVGVYILLCDECSPQRVCWAWIDWAFANSLQKYLCGVLQHVQTLRTLQLFFIFSFFTTKWLFHLTRACLSGSLFGEESWSSLSIPEQTLNCSWSQAAM